MTDKSINNIHIKRTLKFLKWIGLGLVVLIFVFFLFVQITWDKKYDAPYPDVMASTDSAVIARGMDTLELKAFSTSSNPLIQLKTT